MPSISTHADRPSTSQATPIRSRKLAEHIGREIVDFDLHLTAAGEVPTPMYQEKVVNINALGYDGKGDPGY